MPSQWYPSPRYPSTRFHIVYRSPCHSRVSGLHEASSVAAFLVHIIRAPQGKSFCIFGFHCSRPILRCLVCCPRTAVANPDSLCLRACITFFKLELELNLHTRRSAHRTAYAQRKLISYWNLLISVVIASFLIRY